MSNDYESLELQCEWFRDTAVTIVANLEKAKAIIDDLENEDNIGELLRKAERLVCELTNANTLSGSTVIPTEGR